MRGMGRLYMHMAGSDPDRAGDYYQLAIRAFEAAPLDLKAGPAELTAGDFETLGQAYQGLASIVGPDAALEHENLMAGAVRSFETALSLAPTTRRHVQLARAYEAAHLWREAMDTYREAIASATPAGTVIPALELARLLEDQGNPGAALEVVTGTLTLMRDPRLSYQAARLHFRAGSHAQALDLLAGALALPDGEELAEAYYMMSVSESVLRHAGWPSRAREHARNAVRLGPQTARYVRQECLVHLVTAPVRRVAASASQHCPTNTTAEGWLLRGMLFLKQAQQTELSVYDAASQESWRGLLRAADEAFLAGQAVLEDAGADAAKVWFDDLRREVNLAEVLSDGRRVVARCRREISILEGSAAWRRLEVFFGHYEVLKCSKS